LINEATYTVDISYVNIYMLFFSFKAVSCWEHNKQWKNT